MFIRNCAAAGRGPRAGLSILLLALAGPACLFGQAGEKQSPWQARFNQAYQEAQTAESAGQWQQAAEAYREVQRLAPHEITTLVALARCYGRLGKNDEAFGCLSEAVEHGWNQTEQLQTEEAFAALRTRDDFAKLIRRIAEIESENLVVYLPPRLASGPAPLLIAFHGRGENPHYFLSTWKEAADQLGAVLVLPRGVRREANNLLNLWEQRGAKTVDLAACAKLAEQAIEQARKRHAIDPERIVLSGYSQGGAVALGLLAMNPERYAGAFVQATTYSGPESGWARKPSDNRGGPGVGGHRVYLIAGELDKLRPQTESAATDLKAAGWDIRLDIVENVGHEPPIDNSRRQAEAVRFILRQDRNSGEAAPQGR